MAASVANRSASTIATQAALAAELGVSRRTVSDWVKAPAFPRNDDGTFPLAKVIRWQVSRDACNNGSDDLRKRKLRAECAKLEAETQAKELKNAEARAELYNAREVDLYLNECAILVKSRLELLADEVASQMPPEHRATSQETVAKVVYRLLLELSGRAFVGSGSMDGDDADAN